MKPQRCDVPSDRSFRTLFAAVATEEEAVSNQADFLVEMFGVTAHNSQRIGAHFQHLIVIIPL